MEGGEERCKRTAHKALRKEQSSEDQFRWGIAELMDKQKAGQTKNSWGCKQGNKKALWLPCKQMLRQRGNNFVSMIESYISYMASTQKELEEYSQMFSLLDQNNDGYL